MISLTESKIQYIKLSVFRITALSLPLIVVFFVREFVDVEKANRFFERLTDVVLIVALLKIGVDVYIPGSEMSLGKVVVSSSWKKTWIAITSSLYVIALVGYFVGIEWHTYLASSLVLNALLFAETKRLQSKYFLFYLFKAPSTYLVLLALLLVGDVNIYFTFALVIFAVIPLYCSYKSLATESENTKNYRLTQGTLVSLLIVFMSWKEAFVSRHMFSGADLPAIVMYSRLTIVVTFAYMLHNAQVPVRMRNHILPKSVASLEAAAFRGRKMNLIWACFATLFVVVFSYFYEVQYSVSVLLLMCASIVLVFIGNVVAALVFVRAYLQLLKVYVLSILVFFVSVLLLTGVTEQTFLKIAIATLLSQLVFAILLTYELRVWKVKNGNKQIDTNAQLG